MPSSSLFSRSGRVDPNSTLRPHHRPPPLDTKTITSKTSSWTTTPTTADEDGRDDSSVLDLSDFLKEEPTQRRRGEGGAADEFGALGSGGLLGSFHQQVGQWGENVTRSLLDAASYRSRSPGSGPPTPRANSPFNPPTRPPPPAPTTRSSSYSSPRNAPPRPPPASINTSSSFSSTFTHSSSPAQTPTLTPSTSSSSHSSPSPFTPSSTLSSFGSFSSSLFSGGGPETPPPGPGAQLPPQPLRSPDSSSSFEEKKPKDMLGKLWRKGAESISMGSRRSSDSGGRGSNEAGLQEDLDATLRPRKSPRPFMVRGLSTGSVRGGGGIEGGTGTGLSRRLSKNFESTASEFGNFLRKTSSSASTASRSRTTTTIHLSSTSPPSPSDPTFLAMPRPPPFFYGGGVDGDASRPTTIPPEEGVARIGVRFGRSASMSSSGSGRGASEDSWGEEGGTGTEESVEQAEIGFGERGRWEWAGFQSPDATRTGFNLVRGDRSPTDTTSPEWIQAQDREIHHSYHRPSPSLDTVRERQTSSTSTLQRYRHSHSSSLSPNFTIRLGDSPSSSPTNDQTPRFTTGNTPPPPLLATPPRPKSTSSSRSSTSSFHSPSHTTNLSSPKFRQARDSPRSSNSHSQPSSPAIAIRIIQATPSKSRPSYASTHSSPESITTSSPERLSPPRTDGSSSDEERAWASAKAEFSESFSRRTSGASASELQGRSRTLTSDSSTSFSSASPTSEGGHQHLLVESPQLTGAGSFSSLLLDVRRQRRRETPSTISLDAQNVLARYYEPSIVSSRAREREREESSGSMETVSDASFVSAEEGEGGADVLERLMVQLEESWSEDEEEEEELEGGRSAKKKEGLRCEDLGEEGDEELLLALQEARGWEWPVPPMREVWVGRDGESGREVQRSSIVDDGVKFFPFDDQPLPPRHVYVYGCRPTSSLGSETVVSTPTDASFRLKSWRMVS